MRAAVRRIFACVGIAMTRLETFICAAFAFAITAAGYLNAENRHTRSTTADCELLKVWL